MTRSELRYSLRVKPSARARCARSLPRLAIDVATDGAHENRAVSFHQAGATTRVRRQGLFGQHDYIDAITLTGTRSCREGIWILFWTRSDIAG